MGVESLDNTITKKMNEAAESGLVIDLCDSDEDIAEVLSKMPPTQKLRVKTESDLFVL